MPFSAKRFHALVLLILSAGPVAAQPAVPGFARFHRDGSNPHEAGHLLFQTLNCSRCHTVNAAPVTDANYKPAPILDDVGARVKRSYLRDFLSDPHKVKPGTTMPNLFAGLEADEKKEKVEALVHFLGSTGTPALGRPDRKGISSGRDLYHKVGCVACHGTRDASGDQEKLFATSVPLGNLKAKYTLASLRTFLENPHQSRPLGRMPSLLTSKEATDVANYLMQGTQGSFSANNMTYAYFEGSWQKLPDFDKLKPKATGETADFDLKVAKRGNDVALKFDGFFRVETEGNYTFHTHSDDGSKLWLGGKLVVNNDGIHPPATKSGKIKLAKGMHKLTVAVFNAGGGFELSVDVEGPGIGRQPAGSLVYLKEEIKENPVGDKKEPPLQPALAAKGKELFTSMGCANCHPMGKDNRRIDAPSMAKLKPEGGCLESTPKKGLPHYALDKTQQTALRAVIQKPWSPGGEAKTSVQFAMKTFNCYACHERDKIGGVEDDLNKHFQTVMPEMGDEGRLPPSLTGVGAKLKTAYFKKVLDKGAHDRPYMHTRMPGFGDVNVGHLVAMCASLDTAEKAPKVALPEPINKAKFAARQMVGPQAFGCVKCHTFAGQKAEGVQGIDLAIMAERLNHDWFYNYMLDPSKYRPGTRMPASFPDGKTLLKNVLDGKAETQIEAIWAYLSDGKAATLPLGLDKKSILLIPTTEAIIYRNFIDSKLRKLSRGIAVGFPERAHLVFDANESRLETLWQGAFLDARVHWVDRGAGWASPMGDNLLHLPAGPSFFVIAQAGEAWPTKTPRELGYKFKGYRLTEDERPTFLYSFTDIDIEDTPNAIETKASPAIRRSFTLRTDNPIDKLYYRAAVADRIEADKDGWFRVNDWRMRIESNAPPIVRASAGKMELLVPIRFKGNSAKVVQEYVW